MTDREIIKVFELYKSTCIIRAADRNWSITIGDVLDLINRQKAENERLQKAIAVIDIMEDQHKYDLKKAKAEAVKEFAERLNKEAEKVYIDREGDFVEADGEIYDTVADWCKKTSDNLVKEMVGDYE